MQTKVKTCEWKLLRSSDEYSDYNTYETSCGHKIYTADMPWVSYDEVIKYCHKCGGTL